MSDRRLPSKSKRTDVDSFLKKVAALPPRSNHGDAGRLLFALDATASRERTWDRACNIQAQMFEECTALGGLELQLCYYRGFREFKHTRWLRDSTALASHMVKVTCAAGITQVERVLKHAEREAAAKKIDAMVYVGDCMEEDIDIVCHVAGKLGLRSVPAFMFQEGNDPIAKRAYEEIARLTGGAYCQFDGSSAQQLRDLLSAVAVFASGGRRALEDFGRRRGGIVPRLTNQMNPRK
ncbi:MAG: VWA domain-containing protein [Pseudomonadota bacterium]